MFLLLFLLVGALVLVYFGILSFGLFWRYVLPVVVVLLALRLVIGGILLLFNPAFWLAVAVLAGLVWLLRRVR